MLAILLTIFSFSFNADSFLGPQDFTAPTTLADTTTNHYVEVDNIFIIGNRRTREKIILRELSIEKGQIIYLPDLQEHLKNDKSKILNTRLFNTVDINVLELSPEKVDIVVRVEERWYTFPVPIFELIDRNFNDWWVNRDHDFKRVKYGLRFNQYNMRGSNERLKLIAQFGITRRYGILYSIPYIDRAQKHGIQLQVNYRENINQVFKTENHKPTIHDSEEILFQQFNSDIKYTYRGRFYTFHEVRAGYVSSKINDSINLLNPLYFNNNSQEQQYLTLSYIFKQDNRDFVGYPLKGYKTEITIKQKGFGIFKDINMFTFDASYARHIDLGKKFYLSNFSNIYVSTPKNQPYSDYHGLGYKSKLVRGYETYIIEGVNYFLNKTTFKKSLIDGKFNLFGFVPNQFKKVPYSIYLKTFFDLGYANNYPNYEQNTLLTNRWVYSGGVGLDIVTYYDSVIRLEYSLNAEGEYWFNFDLKKEF
ncbi:MAG: BamA/TamA family outer membrane protein [Cyclobacteriaceae bacterium]|nr:BamA/TamA family outer membrane protein [Cyclobacteriaceae bacterium]